MDVDAPELWCGVYHLERTPKRVVYAWHYHDDEAKRRDSTSNSSFPDMRDADDHPVCTEYNKWIHGVLNQVVDLVLPTNK